MHRSEYQTWWNMIDRCHNPESASWSYYGERGIGVCDSWRRDFRNFLSDMGERPSTKHSIDRIDNGWHYQPDNCRWALMSEQNSNMGEKAGKLAIYHRGQFRTLTAWAREYALDYDKLRTSVTERGMGLDDAVAWQRLDDLRRSGNKPSK